jgi:hypothetical protein
MGGKGDDRGNDLDKWIEAQRAEIIKLRDELLGQRNNVEKDISNKAEDASSTVRGPFERFKNFVDSNFTTLSEGLRNFPSNISELKERMQQEREARREEEKLIWARWTGSDDSPDFIRMQVERSTCEERAVSRDAVFQLLRQAYEKNKNVPSHKILELYRDNEWKFGGLDKFANPMLSFGGACYYKPETVDNLPSTARWGWPASSPQWLSVDWFKRSPYSPIRLEAYPGLEEEGSKWRAAFEDLLSVALDKPMVSEEKIGIRTPHGKPQSTYYGPGLEWMLSLQCRGILPPQLPSLYKPVSLFDGFDEVKRPRIAPFMHDIAQILDSKSATMYPMVKRDLEALIDEVSIKSGPETEAAPLRRSWGVAPWRVPDTEQDLYDEMLPLVPVQDYAPKNPSPDEYSEMREDLYDALSTSDVDEAASILSECFKEYNQVGELIGDVLDEITDDMDSWGEHLIRESLHRSDIPVAEQKKVTSEFGWSWIDLMDKYRPFDDEEIERETETVEPKPPNTSTQRHRPDVLAQLTTTHTTRSPDGTVTTKVVLKQRFADGTEEERETVHTSQEPPSVSNEKKGQDTEQEKKRKKGGWFWS